MVQVELESHELVTLIELTRGKLEGIKQAMEDAAIHDAPTIAASHDGLQQEYDQTYHLVLKLSMYYQNRDQ